MQYVAHDMGVRLRSIQVDVTVSFEGTPLIATAATMRVTVTAFDDANVDDIVMRAQEISTVSNSIKRGIAVQVLSGDQT